ncbi:ABC transporter ATP-binding protein [Ruixingdingia sedimenti]|uniref:ABC transporter ATP-binding protein n=1 Tax=Ruixingdingia sedimenti TaxID=3073604 RepID=A0ABU1FC15_9RHOB|nr:ABC transporter ATP-binding protein [Xinfangfangia sp. LG-4]MDR5654439.1 ABC transporter ATP-binding protein [Xinfangfangia sp. LG-4]
MIRLENLTKIYFAEGRRKTVADRINAVFPSGVSVALLGRNGAGKSSLLRMIAGTMDPTSGRIVSDGTISWPVGFAGSFHAELTGAQNVRFIARIYGVDSDELIDFVQDFAEIGQHFHLPLRTYSSGMRARLAFGTSMGVRFDTYLVDEVTATGDAAFRKKSAEVFLERLSNAGAVFVSHSMAEVRRLCTMAAVIEDGTLTMYDDVEAAIAHHDRNMKTG